MEIEWKIKPFEALTTIELYRIIQLRIKVFVVEQNCPYQDVDDKDLGALHLMGYRNGELVAYARLLAPGVSYATPSIGRVVNDSSVRNLGIGRELMHEAIRRIEIFYGSIEITISAQMYLVEFYRSLGFEPQGESYLEDDIPHIQMYRNGESTN